MAENILYRGMERDDEEFNSSAESSDTETSEEELVIQMEMSLNQIEELYVNERERKGAKCESCVRKSPRSKSYARRLYGRVAVFLCFVCEIYVCAKCMHRRHRKHEGMEVGRMESERQMDREESESDGVNEPGETDSLLENFVNELMGESDSERRTKLKNSLAIVYDRVEVKHKLDRTGCEITGLCGLENKRWVVCDCGNHCIKIYKVGSHVLQRYIRFVEFGSKPWDVTEIHLKQNSAEPNLVSGSRSDISATDRADPDKQCLIAVTLPPKRQIMVIDLSERPAKTEKVIKTERQCLSLQFYDDQIFTACREEDLDSPRTVYIQSTDGVTLNMFETGIYVPDLAVVSGQVYITHWLNNKVQRRNVEGQVISEFTIERSGTEGVSVDPDNNVYVCALVHDKVYKLDADLTGYESVLDQTAGYIERPHALCCHRNKLFISHVGSTFLDNFVTVVRLL